MESPWLQNPHYNASGTTLIDYGFLGYNVSEFVQEIRRHTRLRDAMITEMARYSEPILLLFRRHFLVLKVSCPNKKDIWVRLDRLGEERAGHSGLVVGPSKTTTIDIVRVCVLESPFPQVHSMHRCG
jgi:hypothetical protein